MQPDPKSNSSKDKPETSAIPPILPPSESAGVGALPPLTPASPPPLPIDTTRKSWSVEQILTILLNLCLGLFLADAVVSLVDDSLILFFDVHVLTVLRGTVFLFALLMAIVIYVLMGLTPIIPKRLFLPITLFNPVAALISIPLSIYFYSRIQQFSWCISLCQVILGLVTLYVIQGRFTFRWPLVREIPLEARRFSWRNLFVFLTVNVFVLLPALLAYFALCAALAVDHFSEGFLALRPGGLSVQVRKYVRADGKTIQLFPMSHIADSDFYRKLALSFPSNSVTLMEGVTDNRGLLTNKITYNRMAASLGLAQQQEEFRPQGKMVRADVDVEQFNTNTIALLNLVMFVHSKGVNAETLLELTQYSPPPHFEEQLWDDLLHKRNHRVLEEIHSRLPQSDILLVPWGAAHMPGIAREIQKSGFRSVETNRYVAIRFRSAGKK